MTANPHPLDPATTAEYLAGREIMAAAGLLAEPVRFAYYGLEEPAKDEVLGGWPVDRRLRAFLLSLNNGESTDVVVSLTRGGVVSARTVDTATEGQLPGDARRADRGLAGDAGHQDRVHAQADRVLRPQPHARRARTRRAALPRGLSSRQLFMPVTDKS